MAMAMVIITRVLRGNIVYDDCKLSFTKASFQKKKKEERMLFARNDDTARIRPSYYTVYVNVPRLLASHSECIRSANVRRRLHEG